MVSGNCLYQRQIDLLVVKLACQVSLLASPIPLLRGMAYAGRHPLPRRWQTLCSYLIVLLF